MENDLSERLINFSIDVLKYMKRQPDNLELRNIKNQIYKSASSVGANYQEAQGGCSRKEFNYKISVSLKEIKESNYWLKIFHEVEGKTDEIIKLIEESSELTKILGTIYNKTRE